MSYRNTPATEVDKDFLEWAMTHPEGEKFLSYDLPKVSKTAIAEAIERGEEVPFARLVTNHNINIK